MNYLAKGLYLDADGYQEIQNGPKQPNCCDKGLCGTGVCECPSKSQLINGISGSVGNVMDGIKR